MVLSRMRLLWMWADDMAMALGISTIVVVEPRLYVCLSIRHALLE